MAPADKIPKIQNMYNSLRGTKKLTQSPGSTPKSISNFLILSAMKAPSA